MVSFNVIVFVFLKILHNLVSMQKSLFANQSLKSDASQRVRLVMRLSMNTLTRVYSDLPKHIIKSRLERKFKKKDFISKKYDLKYMHLLHITT